MMGKSTAVQQWIAGPLLCGALGISACATARPPVTTVTRTEVTTVRQASTSDASPYAPVELQLAREELNSARLALDAREYERARRLAEQALADAQVAEVRAASEVSRRTARDLRLASEALRDTAVRGSLASLPSYPPTELRLAREELDSARLALEVREYERARRLAEQALADARIAEARAETQSARLAARDLRLSIEALRYEAARLAALY